MILCFNYYKTTCEVYSNTRKIFDLDFYPKFVYLLMRISIFTYKNMHAG